MVEQYKIHYRIGQPVPTGMYETTRQGNRKLVMKYAEEYKTDAGTLSPGQWREGLSEAIRADGETGILEIITDHCREHCAWLHKEEDLLDYAMDILAGRIFLCGNECWKDAADKVKEKYPEYFQRMQGAVDRRREKKYSSCDVAGEELNQ